MLFNTTRNNKDYNTESARLVGTRFNLAQRIKLGGICSGRVQLDKTNEKLRSGQPVSLEPNFGKIELRPKGIIIHYTILSERFSWVIPYYRLVIYNAQYFSIHANGNFIRFKRNKAYNKNKKFIRKMLQHKIDSLNLNYYDYGSLWY